MSATIVSIEDLAEWIESQEQNTVDTPYELNITGITSSNISSLNSALGYDIFVDLSETILPSVSTLYDCFNSNKVVYAPVIPDTVISLENCFRATPLKEMPLIPRYVNNLKYAFKGTLIEEVNIESDLQTNYSYAFSECLNLEKVTIKNSAQAVHRCEYTFYGCTNLKEVSFITLYRYNNVTDNCFSNCTNLETVTLRGFNLYYNFFNDENIKTLNLISLGGISTGTYEYNFGSITLSHLETLNLEYFTYSGDYYALCAPSNAQSYFGYLPSLKTLNVTLDGSKLGSSQFESKVCVKDGAPLLETVKAIFKNVNYNNVYYGLQIINFSGCSYLTDCTVLGVPKNMIFKSTNQNIFYGCDSLENVIIQETEVSESDEWHIFRLNIGADTLSGKVFDKSGSTHTISSVSVDKGVLQLPIKNDELWFPDTNEYSNDTDIDEVISKVIQYMYTYFNKATLDPAKRSMVLYADDPDNFVTNIPMGGGSEIEVYPTEADMEQDLPNKSDGSLVGTLSPDLLLANIQSYIDQQVTNAIQDKDSFSTQEVDTGKLWIDGKKIYRKCLTTTNLTGGTEISVASLGIDSFIKLYGTLVDSGNGNKIVIGNYYNMDYMYCGGFYKKSNDTIRFQKGSDISNTNVAIIVLEYTKV